MRPSADLAPVLGLADSDLAALAIEISFPAGGDVID
jgi:hypothetical protein